MWRNQKRQFSSTYGPQCKEFRSKLLVVDVLQKGHNNVTKTYTVRNTIRFKTNWLMYVNTHWRAMVKYNTNEMLSTQINRCTQSLNCMWSALCLPYCVYTIQSTRLPCTWITHKYAVCQTRLQYARIIYIAIEMIPLGMLGLDKVRRSNKWKNNCALSLARRMSQK